MKRTLVAMLLLLALAGCATSDVAEQPSPTGVTAEPQPEATTTDRETVTEAVTSAATRCIRVSEDRLVVFAEQPESHTSFTHTNGYAVLSADFENVYMVAAEMVGTDIPADTFMVLATNDIEQLAPTFTVNSFGREFTMWPDADDPSAQTYIPESTDGVEEALACAQAA